MSNRCLWWRFAPGADSTVSLPAGGARCCRCVRHGHGPLDTARHADRGLAEGSDLVFVGYGIVAPEYHWDDYAGVDVRGKTVLVFCGDPGYGTSDRGRLQGPELSAYGRWSYKSKRPRATARPASF